MPHIINATLSRTHTHIQTAAIIACHHVGHCTFRGAFNELDAIVIAPSPPSSPVFGLICVLLRDCVHTRRMRNCLLPQLQHT